MRILSRYIAREFLRIFTISIISIIGVYLVVDFFENMEGIVKSGAPAWTAVKFFLFKLPFIVYQGIPAGILLSTLLTFGVMGRHNEITAMKAAGVNPLRGALVLFGIAFLLGAMMFALNEWISPFTNRKAEYVWRAEIKKENVLPSFKKEGLWFRDGDSFFQIDFFSPEDRILKGIVVYSMGEGFSPDAIVSAGQAEWQGSRCREASQREAGWCLIEVRRRTFTNGRLMGYEELPALSVSLPYSPEDFRASVKKPEEMNITELASYIRRLKGSGSPYMAWLPDLHLKVAFPFVSLLMVIIGLSFSFTGPRTKGLALNIGLAFALGFSYWVLLAFSLSLGRTGTLLAWLSAWLPNILFGLLGCILIARVRR
mgnify:CR=1 FL=1